MTACSLFHITPEPGGLFGKVIGGLITELKWWRESFLLYVPVYFYLRFLFLNCQRVIANNIRLLDGKLDYVAACDNIKTIIVFTSKGITKRKVNRLNVIMIITINNNTHTWKKMWNDYLDTCIFFYWLVLWEV